MTGTRYSSQTSIPTHSPDIGDIDRHGAKKAIGSVPRVALIAHGAWKKIVIKARRSHEMTLFVELAVVRKIGLR